MAQEAAKGDIAAFKRIYWKQHNRVFSLCWRMTRNIAEAEDVTQKVFLNQFRKIGSFRGESAFAIWLHRMTVNQVWMPFRASKTRNKETIETGEKREMFSTANRKSNDLSQLID